MCTPYGARGGVAVGAAGGGGDLGCWSTYLWWKCTPGSRSLLSLNGVSLRPDVNPLGLEGSSEGGRQARRWGWLWGGFRVLAAVVAVGPGWGGGEYGRRMPWTADSVRGRTMIFSVRFEQV